MSSREFSEEELRAIQAEMERITVDDVLLQTVVTLLNLGARKAGLGAPSGPSQAGGERSETGAEHDFQQVREAIEGARALLPLLERRHADKLGPVRDTLSRLQIAYAQHAREGGPPQEPGAPKPGPAQQSGRLWVPGQ